MNTPRHLLVTGGAGFIGSNFLQYWKKRYPFDSLVVVDTLTYAGNLEHIKQVLQQGQTYFYQVDINDSKKITKIICKHSIDTIVNFAAESHVDRSIKSPDEFIQSNIVGTYNLLAAAKTIWSKSDKNMEANCRFHQISTDEVCGMLGKEESPFNEESPYLPNSPYSASKAAADHLVRAYQHTYHMPTTISICSNNYGPNQYDEKLIPTIIQKCIDYQPIPIYGDGSNIRDWLHVHDHCRALELILTRGHAGQRYAIGGNCEMSNLDLAHLICKIFDEIYPDKLPHSSLINFVKDRPGHDWRYAINTDKMHREFNWMPQISFYQGIRSLILEKLNKKEQII